jgi:FKBP-type peptidyl-prolyl cis-trans isomerase 2
MKGWRRKAFLRTQLVSVAIVLAGATAALPEEGGTPMTVSEGKRVSIEYTLTLADGTKVDSNVGGEPLTYTQGGQEILPALQQALVGLHVGETKQVSLSPEEGYGAVDPNAFREVEKDLIPEEARKIGAPLVARDPSGRVHHVRVHEVKDTSVVLDLNHPLAGKALNFNVTILDIENQP